MPRRMRHWAILIMIACAIIIADQVTKNWVLDNMLLGETLEPIPALVPYFQFTYSHNTGAAFGMLPMAGDIFLILALIIVVVLLFYYPNTPDNAWVARMATGIVVGGALGNILDRLQHGHVIDFIHYVIPGLISNVSNLADHAIVIGVLALAVDNWRRDAQERREKAIKNASTPAESEAIINTEGHEQTESHGS